MSDGKSKREKLKHRVGPAKVEFGVNRDAWHPMIDETECKLPDAIERLNPHGGSKGGGTAIPHGKV